MRNQKTLSIILLLLTLLLALAACGGPSPDTSSQDNTSTNAATTPALNPTDVLVTLQDTKILPAQKTFKPGVLYNFVVANAGTKHHGFVIVLSVIKVAQMTTADLQKSALVFVNDLAPGQSMEVVYTFPASAVGVDYVMTSPLQGDPLAGTKVSISVKQ